MNIYSMTGFARASATFENARLAWELKTVNAKGLDIRLRLPPGYDELEAQILKRLSGKLRRGTCTANLTIHRDLSVPDVQINIALLNKLIAALADVSLGSSVQPARLDGLLALRGVVEVQDQVEDKAGTALLNQALFSCLDEALETLLFTRLQEGTALGLILKTKLDKICHLIADADQCPGRQPEAIKARLAQTIAALTGQANLDPNRLHQEALILAAKADITEELDRLKTHAAAALEKLEQGGESGRRLDFLAQELNREANTLCAKSNDAALTSLGLELRAKIEQFREQVQNLE